MRKAFLLAVHTLSTPAGPECMPALGARCMLLLPHAPLQDRAAAPLGVREYPLTPPAPVDRQAGAGIIFTSPPFPRREPFGPYSPGYLVVT